MLFLLSMKMSVYLSALYILHRKCLEISTNPSQLAVIFSYLSLIVFICLSFFSFLFRLIFDLSYMICLIFLFYLNNIYSVLFSVLFSLSIYHYLVYRLTSIHLLFQLSCAYDCWIIHNLCVFYCIFLFFFFTSFILLISISD